MTYSLIGHKATLINPQCKEGHELKFSSTLDKVGHEWDRIIKNYTLIEIISDPFVITNHSLYGNFEVINILEPSSNLTMWVPLRDLKIESKFSC